MDAASPKSCEQRSSFQLCFRSLLEAGRAYVFPCDAAGRVNLDALGEHARNDYFYARTVVGREFSRPLVQCAAA